MSMPLLRQAITITEVTEPIALMEILIRLNLPGGETCIPNTLLRHRRISNSLFIKCARIRRQAVQRIMEAKLSLLSKPKTRQQALGHKFPELIFHKVIITAA